jgi:hypothetical protein
VSSQHNLYRTKAQPCKQVDASKFLQA